jgi:hypothetical protein
MPTDAVAFAVELVAEDELVVHLPAAVCTDPRFYHRLAVFLAQDTRPAARLGRRDELIRELVGTFYTGSTRARALLRDAGRYAATGWLRDRGCVGCPARLRGTAEELIWRAFKACPYFPSSLRQMQNILSAGNLRNT